MTKPAPVFRKQRDAGQPKDLEFWNTSAQPLPVAMRFMQADGGTNPPEFGDFARVSVKSYRVEDLRVQTLGLLPYRARVDAPEPVWLETPRLFLPGYRARVDGQPAAVSESPNFLAMVRLAPGVHEVSVEYRTTAPMKLALTVSALAWLGVIGWAARRIFFHPTREPLPAS